ncbi:GNAT family N-acetyltransferase [Arsenicicoccus sp. oral taxon 190]|uniref:GNAT family N-acetyltransferase n=1 Tax=Arsenicicoccus sp. oral taxon 190 TaxID=1658671 RepID=UPI00209E8596|nr:GNAT family protein [Arsenicicoccus sp. oral taxon 190]
MPPVIRPLTLDDVPELTALLVDSREHLAPWDPLRPERFFTEAGQREMVRLAITEREGGRMGPYAIVAADGRLAGRINLNNVVRGAGQYASIGYWVGAPFVRQGLATQAVSQLCTTAFEQWGLHRLEAGTLLHNVASQRVLERNGFELYGLARKYVMIAGRYQDHRLYELLAPELR